MALHEPRARLRTATPPCSAFTFMPMTNGGDGADPKGPDTKADPPRRHRVSVVGVLGELLITAGVLVLMFLGWQVWLNDIIEGAAQDHQAQQLGESWKGTATKAPPKAVGNGTPVVGVAPANAQKFGIIYVPRFGPTW